MKFQLIQTITAKWSMICPGSQSNCLWVSRSWICYFSKSQICFPVSLLNFLFYNMYLYPAYYKLTRTITSIICFLSDPGVIHLPSSHGCFFFSPCHQPKLSYDDEGRREVAPLDIIKHKAIWSWIPGRSLVNSFVHLFIPSRTYLEVTIHRPFARQ